MNGKIVGVLLAGVAIIVGAYLVVSNAPVVLTVWIILCLGVGFTRDNRTVGWSCGNPFYYGYGFTITVDDGSGV